MGSFLSEFSSLVWGLPLLIFLLVANLILIFHSKFVPLKGFLHSIDLVKNHNESSDDQVSHFSALCNALAATIGLGNISGVAVAIYQGGAGAVFWMWVAAFLGMNTKFFECTLAIMYRDQDYLGNIQGGPMYYIQKGLNKNLKPLAIFFAICGLIGTLALFQINQLSVFLKTGYQVDNFLTAIIFTVIIFYILLGGLKRITSFTTKIVPLMSVLYFVLCIIILVINYDKVWGVFTSIFVEALTGKSISGGFLGYGVMHIMKTGIKRAAFSNEAGIGTAPMAHGNAKTDEPIAEGYVAMLGPFIDTIIVCTLTALVILVNKTSGADLNGIALTTFAFERSLGELGKHLLAIIILMFSFSTMIGMANYNKKCWDYVFKGRFNLGNKSFIAFYSLSIFFGALIKMSSVVDLVDIAYGLMALPNVIAVIILAPKVKRELQKYNQKFKV
ncbi:MAG: alanine:cation symporter family protein [Bacteriovoracaceae bacterium]|jgi:AGCS family alanine or glycine:cation symporter|nr:alanine:cation symporter family protein [Bacteriovoracaceae bacterium]